MVSASLPGLQISHKTTTWIAESGDENGVRIFREYSNIMEISWEYSNVGIILFSMGFSIINQPFIGGTPLIMDTPKCLGTTVKV